MVYGACSYLDLLGINFEQEMNHFKVNNNLRKGEISHK